MASTNVLSQSLDDRLLATQALAVAVEEGLLSGVSGSKDGGFAGQLHEPTGVPEVRLVHVEACQSLGMMSG